jgi:FkbM family methyltransferase
MPRDIPPVSQVPISGALLQRLVGADARVILEIGASHGMHTALFLRDFPGARIHAFEPDPRAAASFRANVRDRRATLHEIAIGATNGRAEFHASTGLPPDAGDDVAREYPKGWDQSGSLRAPTGHRERWPWVRFPRTIKVEVRTLDTWSAKHEPGQIDFIWADMQGAEGDMIAGGPATLARTRFLYAEYSDTEIYAGAPNLAQLLDLLPGFEVVRLYPDDVLLRNAALVPEAAAATL